MDQLLSAPRPTLRDTAFGILPFLAVLAVKMVGAAYPGARTWGIHDLFFLDVDVKPWVVFTAEALLLVLVLAVMRALESRRRAPARHSGAGALTNKQLLIRRIGFGLGAASLIATCWAFRDGTHLLGDGGRIIRDAYQDRTARITEILAGFLNIHAMTLLGRVGIEPIASLELLSCLFGAASAWIVVRGSAALVSGRRRILLVALLLTAGGSQFFFGYVESYPLLWALVQSYLLASLAALKKKAPVQLPAVLLGLAAAGHASAVVLAPAHVYLAAKLRPRGMAVARAVAWTAAQVAVPLLSAGTVLALAKTSGHLATGLPFAFQGVLLPVSGSYSVLSANHLLDLANEIALVAPVGVPLAVLTLASRRTRQHFLSDPGIRFLGMCTLGFSVFALSLDPVLGMARDWDLFATALLPPMLAVTYGFSRYHKEAHHLGTVAVLTSLCCLVPWIAVNHQEPGAVRRFKALLVMDSGRPGTAYGYEILGIHLRDTGRVGPAIHAFEKALALRPGFPRYLRQLGKAHKVAGDLRRAEQILSESLLADPTNEALRYELALLCGELGDYGPARKHFETLRQSRSHAVLARLGLAKLELQLERYGEAEAELREVMSLDPNNAEAHYLLGVALIGLKRHQEALDHLQAAGRLGWDDEALHYFLGVAHFLSGQLGQARAEFQDYLEREPTGRLAAQARMALEQIRTQ